MEYKPGMLAKSLAGHDQNKLYVIMREDEMHVFLCDGKIRTLDKLKKKKKKHVQLISKIPAELADKLANGSVIYNEDIRKAIGGNTECLKQM